MTDYQQPPRTYSVERAARRVHRTTRTIERWIAAGDLEAHEIRSINGKIIRLVIQESDLLTTYRAKLSAPRGGKGHARPKVT